MGKYFREPAKAVQILSVKNKTTIKTIISLLATAEIKSRYQEDFGEFVLEVRYRDVGRVIGCLAYIIEKKNLVVNCWKEPFWKQYAPEFWQSRNTDVQL